MSNWATEIKFSFNGKIKTVHSCATKAQLARIKEKDGNLSESDIELLMKDIKLWRKENINAVGYDSAFLWNGKMFFYSIESNRYKTTTYKMKDFYRFVSGDCLILFSVDGSLYRMLNYNEEPLAKQKLNVLLKEYGLMLDFSDYCYWEVVSENKY